jgi:glycosyltransferase involved in cell wall biosynthesis
MTELRVALTVEQLFQPAPGGSGTYIRELVPPLSAHARLVGVAARGHHTVPEQDLGIPVLTSALPRPALYEAWNRLRRPRLPGAADRADVVHATTWAVPPARGGLVVTVHDLAFLRAPEHFTPRGNAYFRRALEVTRREADAVIVPSQASADDCLHEGFDADRIRVVPHGVRVPEIDPAEAAAIRARLGLDRPFVFWCGTFEPRKNLPALLDAFARIAPDTDLDLVLAGPSGWGGADADVRARLTDRVRLLGRLSLAELHVAYAAARAFCFPSTWEGFGMPVLEAMAHGTPVVTSVGTSMAEFTADAGLLVDPTDPSALAEALLAATGDEHDRLAGLARRRAADSTWSHAAELTAAAYRDAAAARSTRA